MIYNILLSGVGGQGILLAAKIISKAAELAGYEVTAKETHGMAQRGGSVMAQIKFGEKVHSPLILEGTADVLASLEHIEAIRCAHYLKPGGLAVVAKQSVIPVTVSCGNAKYPQDVEERLNKLFSNLKYCDCVKEALELGDVRLANTILIGMLSNALPLPMECWEKAIEGSVKPATVKANLDAFARGRVISQQLCNPEQYNKQEILNQRINK